MSQVSVQIKAKQPVANGVNSIAPVQAQIPEIKQIRPTIK
jgi:hypothetical protein